MPLLHLASRVSIFTAPQYEGDGVDAADLAESLSWQGVRAHQVPSPRDEASTGAALGSAAVEQQATNDRNGRLYAQSPATDLSRWCDETPPGSRSSPIADEPLNCIRIVDRSGTA
jgi:hypothetical protein